MSVTKIEACKRALSLTAERVLGLPLDLTAKTTVSRFTG